MTAGDLAIVVATVLCTLGFAALVVVLLFVLRALGDLRPGVRVRQGQLIGLAGHSGKTATDRVRLELRREENGETTQLDPLVIARGDEQRPASVGAPLTAKQLERFKAETAPWLKALRQLGD